MEIEQEKSERKDKKQKSNMRVVTEISIVCMASNIFLAVIKLIAGFVANSAAMISDAVHTISDIMASVIVLIGYGISRKEGDAEHPYGHERVECIAAMILGTVLALVGLGIGWGGIQKIMAGLGGELAAPGALAIWAAIISIVVKEAMYWYTWLGAKKINSGVLKADAWHHRSDALSSVGALIGIGGARLGYPILDPVVCIVICLFILKAAFDIYKDAVKKLIDESCDVKLEGEMRELVLAQEGVLALDLLQTRLFGDKIYVDVEIACDSSLSLWDAHEIAENIHDKLEAGFEHIKHCMVHVNPYVPPADETVVTENS